MYCYYFNLESIYPASITFLHSCFKMCPGNNTGLANFYSLFSPIPLTPKDFELEMLGGHPQRLFLELLPTSMTCTFLVLRDTTCLLRNLL